MAEHTSPLSLAQRLQDWSQMARQVIDIRLALVIGLLAFMVAVSVDSAGNTAAAADLAHSSYPNSAVVAVPQPSSRSAPRPAVADQAVAQRLHHGILTSAILTSSRMTEAHFFTDLPAGE